MNELEFKKINGLKEAIKLLEDGVVKRVEFDMEVEGVGQYRGRMYKCTPHAILIDLEKTSSKKE